MKFFKSILLTLPLLAFVAPTFAETKIGFIDMQKAIQETKAGKAAKKQLEAEFNKKKAELQKKEADLKKKFEDFEKKAMALSNEVKAKKQQELQIEMQKHQQHVAKSQMEIQKKERDLTKPIIDKMQKIISDLAKKEGYTAILEKSEQLVLFAQPSIDLTDKVVKEYNK
ncbi:MAG TPA: hypothetical protein DCL41_00890 [Bdellovibrionales bacterium]|nr:hypothetical protein [Pseudobdellovibrionaceae bacterium]HAG90393.1 hypothetical protein [Bdellovibrionales bacterium]|tara:strand:- start:3981 stop:4487 length:507 start_codon:yes stop_codon:yes gene_type:complete